MTATSDLIQKIYIGYFGRAGDPSGLQYWVERSSAGMSDAAIAQSFSVQDEAKAMYGFLAAPSLGMGQDAFLESVYQNLFERSIDSEGLAYYKGQLNNGRPVGSIILDIINGARNTSSGQDLTTVTNKLSVANYYTEKVINANATWTLADDQADAISVIADVTSNTATVTTGKALADTLVAADTVPVGSTFTLTTSVDGVSGSAGNDTINGVIGNSSGTYSFGDDIRGGSGTDTLNILDGDGTAVGVVSLDGVEVVNVRTLVSGGGNVTELNAADWSGVATLTNASSTDDSSLEVSGLSIATDVTLYGEASIGVNYANLTSGTDTATVSLIGAGSARSATTYASANTEGGLATIDIDLDNGGLVDAVNIQASGTNYVTLEGGADLRTINVSGSGAVYMATDDLVTGFNAAGFNGTLQVTFNGASDVNVVGGAGNDTFNFGTTISNSDSVNGGSGSDTISFTVGGFNRTLQTTAVETATITFVDDNGGAVNATASTVGTYNLRANSAGADGAVNGMATASTVNLTASSDAFGSVNLDGASGAQSLTIVAGTASGASTFDLTASDFASVNLSNVAGTANNAGTLTIGTASFDSDTKSIAINAVTGTGDMAFTDILVGGATSLSITSNASAGLTFGTGISGSALSTVTITQNGSADVVGETLKGTGLTTITLDANGGGNIYLADPGAGSGLLLGNGGSGGSVASIALNLQAETNSDVGTAAAVASGIIVNTTGAVALGVNISAPSASGGVHLGVVTVALGNATGETTNASITISAGSIGTNSIVRTETINIDGMTGTQVNVGAATVGASATYILASGGVDATNVDNVDVSAGTLTLAASAIVAVGAITTTAGAIGAINIVASDGASATYGAMVASAVGAISVSVASGASANFGDIVASGSAANSIVGAVGAIELSGSDGGGVTFGTIGASAVGAVSISGALDVTFGTITANRIGTVDARNQGASGALTIDLSGVSAAAEVYAGAAANVIISGKGNDVITLLAGRTGFTGNDVIRFTTSTQDTDLVVNFVAGAANSGGDQIELEVASFSGNFKVGTGSALAAASVIAFSTGEGSAYTFDDTIVVLKTAYANTAAMLSDFTGDTTLGSAIAAASGSADYLVVWTDGSDTYVSQVSVDAESSAGETTLTLGSASAVSVTTLVQLQGVSPGALSANVNFDIV